VHKSAQTKGIRARRKCLQEKYLRPKDPQTVKQPFMFHYRSVLVAWSPLLPFPPRETGKQLKHSETGAAPAAALKHSETIRGKSESVCHDPPFPRPTG
jgi:hypothetical protein